MHKKLKSLGTAVTAQVFVRSTLATVYFFLPCAEVLMDEFGCISLSFFKTFPFSDVWITFRFFYPKFVPSEVAEQSAHPALTAPVLLATAALNWTEFNKDLHFDLKLGMLGGWTEVIQKNVHTIIII